MMIKHLAPLFFCAMLFVSCIGDKKQIDDVFAKYKPQLDFNGQIRLKLDTLVTAFDWDTLFIIYPYNHLTSWQSIDEIEDRMKINLFGLKNGDLNEQQDFAIFCFVRNRNMERYMILPGEDYDIHDPDYHPLAHYLKYRSDRLIPADCAIFTLKSIESKMSWRLKPTASIQTLIRMQNLLQMS